MKTLWKGLGTSLMMVGITVGQSIWGGGWTVYPAAAAQPLQTMTDFAAHPARESILLGLQKGFIWKYPDGRFYPDKQIVQSQFVASLVAIRGIKETAPVHELPAGHWAKGTYERAKKAGILTDIKIDPNKLLTKEEAAQLVFNAWKPYRGVKMNGYTNTGALITWGWMDPAPAGQPKFREDLPVTRGDAAKMLAYLWKDKGQLELGAKWAEEFEKSLKISNGQISGIVPKGDKNFTIRVSFVTLDNGRLGYLNGESFKVDIKKVNTIMVLSIRNNTDSSDAGIIHYQTSNLKRELKNKQFSLTN
ncbi:S-layer homology domain-containing protein [Brevibacillus choshinensis]|nr:S-layer homology domain-containing protein [Brevibacillus choshinensis]